MKVILLLCSLVMAIGMAGAISIPIDMIETYIGNRCFNESNEYRRPLLMGQNQPVGASVENLIALIEKIERKKPGLSALETVIMILKRFHIDGLQKYGDANEPSSTESSHRRITENIMTSQTGTNIDFPEDILTEDEKCALFYTISHTVNETARYDDLQEHIFDRQIVARAPPAPSQQQSSTITGKPVKSEFLPKPVNKQGNMTKPSLPITAQSQSEPKPETEMQSDAGSSGQSNRNRQTLTASSPNVQIATKMPREKGVASFRNDRYQAIAMNRVLLGAAVGLINPAMRSTRDIVKALRPDVNIDKIVDGQLDPLMAVTLSDLLGIDAGFGLSNPTGPEKFGADGEWNSTACSTTYRLRINGTIATMAEFRGGLDGYNLGRKIKEVVDKNPNMPLSQLLRMYYSPRGLMSDSGYCNRGYGSADLQNKLPREAENYIRVWNGVFHGGLYPDNKLTGYVSGIWNQFNMYLQKAASDKPSDDREYCIPSVASDIKQAPCETPSDVFFLIDNNGRHEEQIEMITQVIKTLDLRRYGGTTTILVNSQQQSNIIDDDNLPLTVPLLPIIYNTTSTQCATCRVAWFDNRNMPINERPLLLELINKTLMEYELKRADQSAVPSKSFVWFDYDNMKKPPNSGEPKRKYDDFKWRLRYEHRDVPLFLAALNKDSIKDLIRRDEDFIPVGTSVEDIRTKGQLLAKKICENPATFQHNECRAKKSQDKVYEGFLTVGYKQYWAMYPEYFIKSYDIDLRFKAESAKVKVCFDRYPNPERDDRKCQESKDDGSEIKFTVKNPCDGKTFENCQPFYFTIALNTQSVSTVQCTDARCKSLDQIKYTFTHSGISCNSGHHIMPLMSFQIICVIIFSLIYFVKHN